MKILEINSVCGIKSTGRITIEIAKRYLSEGNTVVVAYGRENVPEKYKHMSYRIGNEFQVKLNAIQTRVFDNDGFTAYISTKKFLKWADEYNPDLLWLHNLHGYYINVKLLFDWIKSRPNMMVNWTLHDCWAFTGHCSYYTYEKCDKWKTKCYKCRQKKKYPASYIFDASKRNYELKKECFSGVKNMKLITPSEWLASEVRESFLKAYPVEVIHNTIDYNCFRPVESDVKKNLGIAGKKVILGVAAQWQVIKGFYDFIKLANIIKDDYVIVLVGVTAKQKETLPSNIIGIERTSNVEELARIYSAADVFVNPTYEDNYPTTNLEAQACGTPCVTYRTGGSVESVPEENVIEVGDLSSLWKRVEEITGE